MRIKARKGKGVCYQVRSYVAEKGLWICSGSCCRPRSVDILFLSTKLFLRFHRFSVTSSLSPRHIFVASSSLHQCFLFRVYCLFGMTSPPLCYVLGCRFAISLASSLPCYHCLLTLSSPTLYYVFTDPLLRFHRLFTVSPLLPQHVFAAFPLHLHSPATTCPF